MYGLVRLILSPETTGPIDKIKALIDFWSVQDRNMGLYGLARGVRMATKQPSGCFISLIGEFFEY